MKRVSCRRRAAITTIIARRAAVTGRLDGALYGSARMMMAITSRSGRRHADDDARVFAQAG